MLIGLVILNVLLVGVVLAGIGAYAIARLRRRHTQGNPGAWLEVK